MIIKYYASITIDSNNKPRTEQEWEKFNIELEAIMEKALESIGGINTAEVIMEEIK